METSFIRVFEVYPIWIEYSIFLTPVSTFIFLAIVFVFFMYKPFFKKQRKNSFRFDFSDAKKTAYQITFLTYKYNTPYNKELLKKLEAFKYKKKVGNLDEETLTLIKKFLEYVKKNA